MVLTGWYVSRLGTPPPFAAKRLSICEGCAFNSKNVKRRIRLRAPYCTLCKCDLKALAVSDGGKCKMNKWPPPFNLDELIENLIK
jgi:hypothetical protein